MEELSEGYTFDTNYYEKHQWAEVMSLFQDANLYQAWAYDMVRYGRRGVCHLLLRRKGALVAAAQARVVRLPGIGSGIAYMGWGPMWRLKGAPEDVEVFRQTLRALRNEFSHGRGLVLRLYPLAYCGDDERLGEILQEEGYRFQDTGKTHQTLIIDLTPSLAELRSALDQKWRNCLNRAEKNGPDVIMGEEDHLFGQFIEIYSEMLSRKGLVEAPSDVNHLRVVQRELSPALKLKIILCRINGDVCAGGIFSAIGTMAIYLAGATSDAGMKTNGSYVVQWAFVKWLKENGFLRYDLNGINPHANPGTYHFKRGLAGKFGREMGLLGRFQVADGLLSDWVVKGGEGLMSGYRRIVRLGRSARHAHNKGR
jgi:hypothetical protein